MNQIIVLKEKYGDVYYDASTPELESAVFRKIFWDRENSGDYYFEEDMDSTDKILYEKAKTDNIQSIKKFLDFRNDAEYESFSIEDVI